MALAVLAALAVLVVLAECLLMECREEKCLNLKQEFLSFLLIIAHLLGHKKAVRLMDSLFYLFAGTVPVSL